MAYANDIDFSIKKKKKNAMHTVLRDLNYDFMLVKLLLMVKVANSAKNGKHYPTPSVIASSLDMIVNFKLEFHVQRDSLVDQRNEKRSLQKKKTKKKNRCD